MKAVRRTRQVGLCTVVVVIRPASVYLVSIVKCCVLGVERGVVALLGNIHWFYGGLMVVGVGRRVVGRIGAGCVLFERRREPVIEQLNKYDYSNCENRFFLTQIRALLNR